MNPVNSEDTHMRSSDDEDEIQISLKPMNITEIHKRDVTMGVNKYQMVGEFAQTLINILGVKETQSSDANFLY